MNVRSVLATEREILSQVQQNTICCDPFSVRMCFNDVKWLYKQEGGGGELGSGHSSPLVPPRLGGAFPFSLDLVSLY